MIGTNTPLIKIRGNLINVAKTIIFEGLSVGGEDINTPKDEKQKEAIIIPITKGKVIISKPNKAMPTKRTNEVTKSPKTAEASISPRIIAQRDTGEETSLSNVFIFVSHGAIIGVIAETAKKRAIPTKPGIKKSVVVCLLKTKAMNKKEGINNPWIKTEPRR